MKISYSTKKVEKCFSDYSVMKRSIDPDWVRIIKKHIDRLEASNDFGIFLSIGLGHPEPLTGDKTGMWSLRISSNVRLIFTPINYIELTKCTEIRIEGVADYHGSKPTWYIF